MAVWHVYVSLHLMWLAAARSSSPLLPMPQCKALGPAAAPRGALVPVAPSAPCSMAGWPAPRRTRADHADRHSLLPPPPPSPLLPQHSARWPAASLLGVLVLITPPCDADASHSIPPPPPSPLLPPHSARWPAASLLGGARAEK